MLQEIRILNDTGKGVGTKLLIDGEEQKGVTRCTVTIDAQQFTKIEIQGLELDDAGCFRLVRGADGELDVARYSRTYYGNPSDITLTKVSRRVQ